MTDLMASGRGKWLACCDHCRVHVEVAGTTEAEAHAAVLAAGWMRWRWRGVGQEQWRCTREASTTQELRLPARAKRYRG